jgi:SEC-C motif-containing protein
MRTMQSRPQPHPAETTRSQSAAEVACPCGAGSYRRCCGRFLEDGALPGTALELMRARYSAYALQRFDFVRSSWHPATCPAQLDGSASAATRWLGLEIRDSRVHPDATATIEFVARYRIAGRGYRLHERSRFECIAGRWAYRDGEMLA